MLLTEASRFLRARRFVPQDALVQFEDTEKWRKANNIAELYNEIDVEHYHEARSLVNDAFCRRLTRSDWSLVSAVDWPSRSTRHSPVRVPGQRLDK